MPPPNSIDRFRHFQSAVSFIPSVIIAQEPKIARACAVFKEIFVAIERIWVLFACFCPNFGFSGFMRTEKGERFHVRLMVDARVSA